MRVPEGPWWLRNTLCAGSWRGIYRAREGGRRTGRQATERLDDKYSVRSGVSSSAEVLARRIASEHRSKPVKKKLREANIRVSDKLARRTQIRPREFDGGATTEPTDIWWATLQTLGSRTPSAWTKRECVSYLFRRRRGCCAAAAAKWKWVPIWFMTVGIACVFFCYQPLSVARVSGVFQRTANCPASDKRSHILLSDKPPTSSQCWRLVRTDPDWIAENAGEGSFRCCAYFDLFAIAELSWYAKAVGVLDVTSCSTSGDKLLESALLTYQVLNDAIRCAPIVCAQTKCKHKQSVLCDLLLLGVWNLPGHLWWDKGRDYWAILVKIVYARTLMENFEANEPWQRTKLAAPKRRLQIYWSKNQISGCHFLQRYHFRRIAIRIRFFIYKLSKIWIFECAKNVLRVSV